MENQPLKVGQPAPDFELMDENKEKAPVRPARQDGRAALLPDGLFARLHDGTPRLGPELPKLDHGGDAVVSA